MTVPTLLAAETIPEHPRTFRIATIGDFKVWTGRTRQAAWQHAKSEWFAPKLGYVSEGQFPVWSAREAALAYIVHGRELPGLPDEVDALVKGEPFEIPELCGVGEVARMMGISNAGASLVTTSSWFPAPYDYISTQSAIPVWVTQQVREVLHQQGKLAQ